MKKLENITRERIFYHFGEINKIPRGSGNEKQISDYLLNFGRNLGLECIQDGALNVIIKKQASKGYEKAPIVIIQGHMDMVCEKNSEKVHDFTKDPIELITKGDYIYADKTTLGADDGVALAYAMAILEDNTIEHPAIEVLITSGEETGMSGAMAVQPHYINGKIILNIDSEEEGKLLVSCPGGIRTKSTIPIEWIDKKKNTKEYTLVIKGLKGGHSGKDIHLERGNSNKLIGRLLKKISNKMQLNLISLNGGVKNNAIPREATAVVSIKSVEEKKLVDLKMEACENLKREFSKKDPDLRIYLLESENSVEKVFSDDTTAKVINLLYMYPNGVDTISSEIEGLTESSTNLGVLTTNEKGVEYDSSVNSSVLSLRDEIVQRTKCISEIVGGTFETSEEYPAWPYKTDSKIRELCTSVYSKMYGKDPEIVAIHSGIECGVLGETLGDLDMISFGPYMFDIHTPNEHISITSTSRCYKYLLEVLKAIKDYK